MEDNKLSIPQILFYSFLVAAGMWLVTEKIIPGLSAPEDSWYVVNGYSKPDVAVFLDLTDTTAKQFKESPSLRLEYERWRDGGKIEYGDN